MDGGWGASAQAWIDFVDKGDVNRDVLLDPIVLELCGDVNGLHVADIGCGEGRTSRMLAERGASVVGFDLIEAFVKLASERHPSGTYVRANAEQLPAKDDSFDMVISVLSLLDIPDYRRAIGEMARILKPGGLLIVANASSMNTAGDGWVKDGEGNKLYWPINDYFVERGPEAEWANIKVINYHRPLQAYMDAFLGNGLELRRFIEPCPTTEQIAEAPNLAVQLKMPFLVVMQWQKRSS